VSSHNTGSSKRRTGKTPLRTGWIRNAPIRRKLAMIIVIPLATVLALTVLQFTSTVRAAQSASRLAGLVSVSTAAAQLADDLQKERIAAVQLTLGGASGQQAFNDAVAATDESVATYRDRRAAVAAPAGVSGNLADIDRALNTLSGLRGQSSGQKAVASAVALRYEVIVTTLNTYRESVAQQAGQSGTGNEIRAATMLSEAKQDVAYEQALAYIALKTGQNGADLQQAIQASLHSQEQALLTFVQTATTSQQTLVNSSVTGDAVQIADALTAQLSRGGAPAGTTAENALDELGSVNGLMRWVEVQLDAGVTSDVNAYQAQVVQQATVEGVAVTVAIVLALLITVLLARLMSRSLTRLRTAAETVAQRDLPQSVAVLQDPRRLGTMSPREAASRSYRPIPVTSTDEIGGVATAFNGVQREAIRIAVEQAILRNNVSATFVNLARRSQKLVDKMIANLDGIERDEEQPEKLAQLFELDHLATRMRRNDENLLILADADAASPRAEDAALADVLAAAQSEIAHYDRIEFGPLNIDADGGDVMITAGVVNDIVRLFAELLENAASFSSPDTRVMVAARRVADRMIVEIEDHGIGMTQERRERINEQLAHPAPTASGEPGALRMMGFAVVSKLAARHHIHIELGSAGDTGTVVHVVLPPPVLTPATPPVLPGRPHAAERPDWAENTGGWPAPGSDGWPAGTRDFTDTRPRGGHTDTTADLTGRRGAGFDGGRQGSPGDRPGGYGDSRSDPGGGRGGFGDSGYAGSRDGGYGDSRDTGRTGGYGDGRDAYAGGRDGGAGDRPDAFADLRGFNDDRSPNGRNGQDDLRTEGWPAPDATMELPTFREQHRSDPIREAGRDALRDSGRQDFGRDPLHDSGRDSGRDPGRQDFGRELERRQPDQAASFRDGGREPSMLRDAFGDSARRDAGRSESAFPRGGRPGHEPAALPAPVSDWFSSPSTQRSAGDPAPAALPGRPDPVERFGHADRPAPTALPSAGNGGNGNGDGFDRSPAGRPGWPEPPPRTAPRAPAPPPAPVPAHNAANPRHARSGLAGTPEIAPITWHTRADAGWQAARRATEAPEVTTTHHGLPKRNPMAHLVPGSAVPETQAPVVARRPESVRSVLTEYQRGVRNGRHQYTPGSQPTRDANHVQER
jgi:signal transduction histidine kinase